MKVAIHRNTDVFEHSTTWDHVWVEYCGNNNVPYEIVDCFAPGALDKLRHFDILLWHFSNYSATEMRFARSILMSAEAMGLKVFPNTPTSWHFDDKIAQSFALHAIDAPTAPFTVMYRHQDVLDLLTAGGVAYPSVAKLAVGSGSSNVRLIRNPEELLEYSKTMFGRGINASPDIGLKIASNMRTAKNLRSVVDRIRRIPDFASSLRAARALPREQSYVYLQEFIPNSGYDLKVVVVGEKLSFCGRLTRPHDFRASGGGALTYEPSLITDSVIRAAFETAAALKSQCMGFDFVVNQHTEEPSIIEMSYGFSHAAQLALGAHYTPDGSRVEEPLNAPAEVLERLLQSLR